VIVERTREQVLPAPESLIVNSEEELSERLLEAFGEISKGNVMSEEEFCRRIKERYGFST
jgi:hypothetical protein